MDAERRRKIAAIDRSGELGRCRSERSELNEVVRWSDSVSSECKHGKKEQRLQGGMTAAATR
jgi:hypothetical protein